MLHSCFSDLAPKIVKLGFCSQNLINATSIYIYNRKGKEKKKEWEYGTLDLINWWPGLVQMEIEDPLPVINIMLLSSSL